MSKGVNTAIFKAITLECNQGYKGFTISNDLKSRNIIVEEVYGWIKRIQLVIYFY